MTHNDVSYQDKFIELMLDVTHPNNLGKTYILVEGKSDISLFKKIFTLTHCMIESIPGGNAKLELCVTELVKSYPLIIGIRDSDFINLEGCDYSLPNIFLTDYHDIEMTLIAEDEVFSAIVYEFTHIPRDEHILLRNSIAESIKQVSYLKYLNSLHNLQLTFSMGFPFIDSVDNIKIDIDEYLLRVLSKSPTAKITERSILIDKIKELEFSNLDYLQLCNGHDFISALAYYINKFGNLKICSPDYVSRAFRMTYRFDFFSKTNLYLKTKEWADSNLCSIYR